MDITRIVYRELRSEPGSFSNRAVEMEATVESGDAPFDVLQKLKQVVQAELGGPPQREQALIKNNLGLVSENDILRRQIKGMEKKLYPVKKKKAK
jgi:hypothetical protein